MNPDQLDDELAAFTVWARMYYGPWAPSYLERSGPHFLFPQTAAMFAAWLAAKGQVDE